MGEALNLLHRINLLSLPDEILLAILHVLELPELLAVRELCHKCLDLSHDRALWLNLLSRAHNDHIPLSFDPNLNLPSGLPTPEVETIVRSACRVAHQWPLPRSRTPVRPFGASGRSLMGLQIFLDKWLLAVYSEGYAYVWHIDSPTTAKEWVTVNMEYDNWSSYDACLENIMGQNSLVLAVTRALACAHCVTVSISSIVLTRWGHGQIPEILTTRSDDEVETWNGIFAIRFLGLNHLLVCKMRSVELHEIPNTLRSPPSPRSDHPIAPSVHRFPSTTFREFVFSEPCTADRNKIQMLAYDVLQGLFLYSIHLIADADLPELTVTLVAHPSPTPTGSRPSQNALGAVNPSSRGFVSALTLGPQGKRAIWVERNKGSVCREVIVWPGKVGDMSEMDGKAVFVSGPCGLRQDITHCAFGEISGI
ncbi:hypothetical protein BD779DRAFT_1549874, partial [Infundibulicybe gibba]